MSVDNSAAADELNLQAICLLVILERVQCLGLKLVGHKRQRLKRSLQRVNYDRFTAFYGVSPVIFGDVYHNMQITDIEDAKQDFQTEGSTGGKN